MGAISAANLTRLRTTRHATRLAATMYKHAAIWTARVDGVQDWGDQTITVNNVVQVRAPGLNYLVKFGTYAGSDNMGTARFWSYAAPTLNVSPHNVNLVGNLYVTVVEEVPLHSKLTTTDDNDVVFEENTLAYVDEDTAFPPLACCGAHAVAYLDAAGVATVRFYDRGSQAFNGATIASVTWNWFGNSGIVVGTVNTPGTEAVPNEVEWELPGNYYCSYTVTDSNGKSSVRYFIVFIRDRNTQTSGLEVFRQIEVDPIEGDADSGGSYRTTIRVYEEWATETLIPSGVPVVLFAEDWFGDEEVSIGHEPWRENIVLSGYIRKGTVRKRADLGCVEFEIDQIAGMTDNLWQIAGGLETYSAGENTLGWHVITALNYNLACYHMLMWHSTIPQLCDVFLNLPAYTIEYVDIPDSSLADGLRQAFAAVRSRMGCSREQALYFEVHPQIQSYGDRSTTYVITTTNADYRDDLDMGEENAQNEISQIDFEGLDENAEPLFSLAPPNPESNGGSTERVDGIRVAGQLEANEFSGLYWGWRNGPYKEIVIPWRGNYRPLDIFPAEPIAFNLAAADNPRGYAWTNQRCWIKRCTLEYRAGVLLVSTVVEWDAYGPPGISNTYPSVPPIIPPPEPPPQRPQPPPPPPAYPSPT